MSQNSQPEPASRPPVFSLDPVKLGQIILRLAPSSAAAGHTRVSSTLRDYVDPARYSQELAFVRELFTADVSEVADHWYGGVEAAAKLTAEYGRGLPDAG